MLTRIKTWLATQAQLRKDEFTDVKAMSRPVRVLGACFPLLAFVIVVWAIYSAGNEETILSSTGVSLTDEWRWQVDQYDIADPLTCSENRCWQNNTPDSSLTGINMPFEDPVGKKRLDVARGRLFVYHIKAPLKEGILYLPGIRAESVAIYVNGKQVTMSRGGLPFFVNVDSAGRDTAHVEIATSQSTARKSSYQGFITQSFFFGSPLQVYRTHFRLVFRSFPKHAVVIFLLSIGALTFAFFIFLDHKRELFALGLTISLLGAAFAVRTGTLSFLGTPAFFTLFSLHIAALTWYTAELTRVSVGLPKASITLGAVLIGLYSISQFFGDEIGRPFRFALLLSANSVPLAGGLACIAMSWYSYGKSRDRAIQLLVTAVGMLLYSGYLYADDLNTSFSIAVRAMQEAPLLLIVSTWVISALSSLGSMEKRVQLAVKDREQRLKLEHDILLAQEVQTSFITIGLQDDPHFEVCTVYQAVKKVGGDWVVWKKVNDDLSIGIVGDVVGKGVQAGLVVSASDSILRRLVSEFQKTPIAAEDMVRQIVEALSSSVIGPHENRAMTLMISVVDNAGRFVFTTLGHPPILGVSPQKTRALVTRNTWLNPRFDLSKLDIKSDTIGENETLICFTDGICDGSRELRHFRKVVATWHDRPLKDIAAEYNAVEPDYDDQTLFMIRRKAQTSAGVA